VARLAVLVASVTALLVAGAWALHHRQPEVVGYNGARPNAFVATVAPGRPVCTNLGSGRSAPDGVRITVGTNGNGAQPLRVVLPGAGDGAPRTAGDGIFELPLPAGAAGYAGPACLENLGRRPVLVAGEPGRGSNIGARPQPYMVSYELVDDDPPRWADDASATLRHVGLARADGGGPATGYVVLVLVGLALAGALAATFRWVR
jgi:hypothetical protein